MHINKPKLGGEDVSAREKVLRQKERKRQEEDARRRRELRDAQAKAQKDRATAAARLRAEYHGDDGAVEEEEHIRDAHVDVDGEVIDMPPDAGYDDDVPFEDWLKNKRQELEKYEKEVEKRTLNI